MNLKNVLLIVCTVRVILNFYIQFPIPLFKVLRKVPGQIKLLNL